MFSHAYDIAFEVRTKHDKNEVTAEELMQALEGRVRGLRENLNRNPEHPEIIEACGSPFDSAEWEEG